MKKEIIDLLCCPTCKGDLDLKIDKDDNDDIIEGFFTCKKCKNKYTIHEGIPNLLPK